MLPSNIARHQRGTRDGSLLAAMAEGGKISTGHWSHVRATCKQLEKVGELCATCTDVGTLSISERAGSLITAYRVHEIDEITAVFTSECSVQASIKRLGTPAKYYLADSPVCRSATITSSHEPIEAGYSFDPFSAQCIHQARGVGKNVLHDVIDNIPVPLCPVFGRQNLTYKIDGCHGF